MADRKQNSAKALVYHIFRAVIFCIHFGAALFACRSFTKSQLIFKLYASLWIMHVTAVVFYMQMQFMQRTDLTVGQAIYYLVHMSQMIAHLVTIFESIAMDSKRADIVKMHVEFEKRFSNELNTTNNYQRFNQRWLPTILSFIALIATAVHAILMLTTSQATGLKNVLYWHAMPSTVALQFRILELIAALNILNEYARQLRQSLNEMGERNVRRVFWRYLHGRAFAKIGIIRVMPRPHQPSEDDDERKLRAYKKFYDDIYYMFKTICDSYGWSMLAFVTMYFIYLVIHAYWVIFALIAQLPTLCLLINNLEFLVIVVVLLWILCWQSQISHEQSRHIGCNMFKLVKPFGSKSYNDLVTNFSLQTLHQQYIITAKGFFNLNLNLLGGMFASIVTYLVLLIQFMFAGKSRAERNLMLTGNSTSG